MTIVRLSVTEFAQKNLLAGDIDERHSLMQVDPETGVKIHADIQARLQLEIPDFEAERKVLTELATDDLLFEISGRIDGLWVDRSKDKPTLIVDEIKSTWSISRLKKALDADLEHPYLMQARMYGWILGKTYSKDIMIQLRLVSVADLSEEIVPVTLDLLEFESWIKRRSVFLHALWHESDAWDKRAKIEATKIKFPYATTRPGQLNLRNDVETAAKTKKNLLAQAPTGIGKTAAVMFPALANTLSRGDKLIHITPKNSQQREAESFIKKLHRRKRNIKSLTLSSKSKICMLNTEPTCRPDLCVYAKGHYDKVNEHKLLDQLKSLKSIDRSALQQLARAHEVCPWELARQILPWVDVVIGDYHYGLAPQGNIIESAQRPFDPKPKPVLTIDEAHNLAERSRDWYSIAVSSVPMDIQKHLVKPLRRTLASLNQWFDSHLPHQGKVTRVFHKQELHEIMERWSKQMPKVLANLYGEDSEPKEDSGFPSLLHEDTSQTSLVALWFEWLQLNELLTSGHDVFFAMRSSENKLMVHCGNAGPFLAETFKRFHTVVAFSATLKPFSYHLAMWGQAQSSEAAVLPEKEWVACEYPSPFAPENRCIIAIPQVSTRYRERPRQVPRIVEVIRRVIEQQDGNYIVFFPSFELLQQVADFWQKHPTPSPIQITQQPRMARPSWVQDILHYLGTSKGALIFAVQGGVLSEGIDLPHDQLIGAIIVGPALPTFSPEREEMRRIFDARGEDGFAMAYVHPAMAKSIQSAGRVIRTETDRGIIVLLDNRFLDPLYAASMPEDWIPESANLKELVPSSIIDRLQEFWGRDATLQN